MSHATRLQAWRRHRNAFLGKLLLSLASTTLTLLRIIEFDALLLPLGAVVLSLAAIWIEEDYLDEHQERLLLTAAVALQALLYSDHFGPLLAILLSLPGLAIIWRGPLFATAQRLARHPVAKAAQAPEELREAKKSGEEALHAIGARAGQAHRFLRGEAHQSRRRP